MERLILDLTLEIPRAPSEVRAWWLELPDEYRASDPREQPHRIVTLEKSAEHRKMRTYWRGPMGRELVIPETFRYKGALAWDVDVGLPLGLAQRDEFELEETPEGGTRVHIRVFVWARTLAGRLARGPFVAFYAKRNYPRTWRSAARICARDAPKLAPGRT